MNNNGSAPKKPSNDPEIAKVIETLQVGSSETPKEKQYDETPLAEWFKSVEEIVIGTTESLLRKSGSRLADDQGSDAD